MSFADRALLYARTLRWLSVRQASFLALRRLQRAIPARTRATAPAVAPTDSLARALRSLGPRDGEVIARAERVARGEFEFLGQSLRRDSIDWSKRRISALWTYNLHYFDYACDLAWAHALTGEQRYAECFAKLAMEWIAGTRDGLGEGWDPYPTATRAINWTQALLLTADSLDARTRTVILDSVYAQLLHVERRLEWHLRANHLQRNLQALVLGGLVFTGPEARRWRVVAAGRLWREVVEQVLPDGGHIERSPMYHSIALADLLETVALARAAGLAVPDLVLERVSSMLSALDVLTRPNGELHLFNDSANCIAPPASYLRAAGERILGHTRVEPAHDALLVLERSGYFGYVTTRHDRLLVDCGEPGPAYQPGHSHCDLLSFELDLAGAPFIVDSGVSGYAGDPLRYYARSTRAHNTVTVGGREQHEVWGVFRMARRASVNVPVQERRPNGYFFRGSYAPYYSSAVQHVREISYDGSWQICDRVVGAAGERLDSFLHFHPDVHVEVAGLNATARRGELHIDISFTGVDRLEVTRGKSDPAQGWYAPGFGGAVPAPCVAATVDANAGKAFGYRITRRS